MISCCSMCEAIDAMRLTLDFRTERGYVGRLYENGTMALESPMFISDIRAGDWVHNKIAEFAARGRTLIGRVVPQFVDPNKMSDALARMQDAAGSRRWQIRYSTTLELSTVVFAASESEARKQFAVEYPNSKLLSIRFDG